MPFVEVKLYDKRVTEESVPKIIEAMTAALAESSGAAPRAHPGGRPGRLAQELGHRRQGAGLARPARRRASTSAVSRACSSVVRTISFARAKLSITVGTGATARPSA